MKIEIHHYALQSKGRLNSHSEKQGHKGVLFKITFKDGSVGYSDLHPWPELGDFPLELQLKLLRLGHLTRMTERTLEFARTDARARTQEISLFKDTLIPPSHALITDLEIFEPYQIENLIHQGFNRLKVKVHGKDLSSILNLLKILRGTFIKLRLDCNCKFTRGEFEEIVQTLKPYLKQIEFFEDPIPFNLSTWKDLRKKYEISLACDRDAMKAVGFPDSADYLVIKPAIQKPEVFIQGNQKLVMTTYVDHPIGQVSAAWTAAKYATNLDVCGLLTHHVYHTNPFSQLLHNDGPYLDSPHGTGFGFDHLLNDLVWEELR